MKLLLPPLCADSSKKSVPKSESDGDAALIFPLIILLIAEGHDMMLIFALLSILL